MKEGTDNFGTLCGGKDVEVRMEDGTVGTVRVRQLAIKLYPELLKRIDDEGASLELYCEQKEGWAAGLTIEGHEKLLEAAEALNADFFGRWVRRRLEKMRRLSPGAAEKAVEGLTLPSTLVR